jgi:hypothetical protein
MGRFGKVKKRAMTATLTLPMPALMLVLKLGAVTIFGAVI